MRFAAVLQHPCCTSATKSAAHLLSPLIFGKVHIKLAFHHAVIELPPLIRWAAKQLLKVFHGADDEIPHLVRGDKHPPHHPAKLLRLLGLKEPLPVRRVADHNGFFPWHFKVLYIHLAQLCQGGHPGVF